MFWCFHKLTCVGRTHAVYPQRLNIQAFGDSECPHLFPQEVLTRGFQERISVEAFDKQLLAFCKLCAGQKVFGVFPLETLAKQAVALVGRLRRIFSLL